MLEPSLVLGGVGTRFQSLAGEVRSCRNWDCTRSSALYHDSRNLQTLSKGTFWIREDEALRTHSVPSDIPAPFNVRIGGGRDCGSGV